MVPVYYCHRCAAIIGLMNPVSAGKLIRTQYQLDKYIKHTAPTGVYPVNSIFDDPAYSSYRDYVVFTSGSGCFQIDDRGRTNLIWIAGERVGATYHKGVFHAPDDAVKVVFHDDVWRVHAFPTLSDPIQTERCILCGRPVAY
jgi:hypothetical protein